MDGSDANGNHDDTAGVIAPPPLIFGGAIALGLGLQAARPLPWLPTGAARAAGAALVASAAGLAGSAIATLRRAGTEVDPGRPTTSLVVAGPYRFSRNPIYVAFTLLGLGVAALANAAWVALAVLGALLVVRRGVVEREERYLDRRFGADYGRYRAQVRRWF